MFKAIKEFFTGKPAHDVVAPGAPYKLPEPAAITPIPFVVESPAVETVTEIKVQAIETVTEIKVEAVEPAKKTRKPRVPKAVVAAPPAKKPAAKKAAPKSKKV